MFIICCLSVGVALHSKLDEACWEGRGVCELKILPIRWHTAWCSSPEGGRSAFWFGGNPGRILPIRRRTHEFVSYSRSQPAWRYELPSWPRVQCALGFDCGRAVTVAVTTRAPLNGVPFSLLFESGLAARQFSHRAFSQGLTIGALGVVRRHPPAFPTEDRFELRDRSTIVCCARRCGLTEPVG